MHLNCVERWAAVNRDFDENGKLVFLFIFKNFCLQGHGAVQDAESRILVGPARNVIVEKLPVCKMRILNVFHVT
ncbi:hypothetical protein T10_138 [Trichinella papuae]|uniref:Uncharacterized protein n=1 Tax=Trichinella papuae TaxID=268474 RepID=A0A0V1LXG0_9BILA|nr:hypothetical protein T10_138 [Trichinella papuae]